MSINSRAQIPGYAGFIPGKSSENKFGATFAQVSTGSYPIHPQSFLTTNIANNSFIQQQHTEVKVLKTQEDKFWSNSGKINAFEAPTKKPIERNKRTPIESI